MSLDVTLYEDGNPDEPPRWAIFVREDGATKEISLEEWNRRHPGEKPALALVGGLGGEVFSANITHNLGKMASAAGLYGPLWRPEEAGIQQAEHLIESLETGLAWLKRDPERFKTFNAPNGYGLYEHFVPFVEDYLNACKAHPKARVEVSR